MTQLLRGIDFSRYLLENRVRAFGFYGAYTGSGLVRQISRFCQCVGYMPYSRLDSRTKVSRVIRHMKPLRLDDTSSKRCALSLDRAQAIGVQSVYEFHGAYNCYGFVPRSPDSLLSVPVSRVRIGFSTAGFKGVGKPRSKMRETTALWKAGEASRMPLALGRV